MCSSWQASPRRQRQVGLLLIFSMSWCTCIKDLGREGKGRVDRCVHCRSLEQKLSLIQEFIRFPLRLLLWPPTLYTQTKAILYNSVHLMKTITHLHFRQILLSRDKICSHYFNQCCQTHVFATPAKEIIVTHPLGLYICSLGTWTASLPWCLSTLGRLWICWCEVERRVNASLPVLNLRCLIKCLF